MSNIKAAAMFWVHSAAAPQSARLHRRDCLYCNAGTGFARRPASPGGAVVWTSHQTLDEARAYLNALPYADKADCKTCMP